ncbi:filamentous hemagglutinin N-terminal domain-containing protein, partial [Pseudomonadales bacterium]|nr:filamentous hemagglutinin N-terminal domain-containing protein [Pseudomonadales bacterium]
MDLMTSKPRNMTCKMTVCTFAWSIDMHFKSYLALSFVLLSASIGHAEVTFDGSVGLVNAGDPVSSGNGYTYNITADLGEQAGANLFHSFAKFNIGSGELAHFSGPASIVNIVSRVTGGESSISGEITSSISGASLWLVNPAGFIFTNGAVVDVDGNFHLSSAEYLEFADGARFFSNLSAMSTLSTGDISSFGFLGTSTGAIKIDGTSTTIGEVDSLEHNLTVNSDFVSIRDANLYAQEISIGMNSQDLSNINLRDSLLETNGGGIFFEGGTIFAVDTVIAGYGSEGISDDVTVQLTAPVITLSNVEMRGGTRGLGSGSDILLGATTISISDGSTIDVSSSSTLDDAGDAGTVSISAQDVDIADTEILLDTLGGGLGGSLTIEATDIGLSQTSIKAQTEGLGEGGQISMRGETIAWSDVAVNASSSGAGVGGSIVLSADTISIVGGSALESDSFSSGDGGAIILTANSAFNLANARIEAEVGGSGTGGLVEIKSPEITLGQDSEINISALSGTGDAGVLTLAGTTITAVNADIKGETFGEGEGADIALTAGDIALSGTLINSSTKGVGAGGFIVLNAD